MLCSFEECGPQALLRGEHTFTDIPEFSLSLRTHSSCHISSLSLPVSRSLSSPSRGLYLYLFSPSICFMLSTVRPWAGTSLSTKPDLDVGLMAGEALSLVQIIPLFPSPLQNNTLLSRQTTIQALMRQPLFMTLVFWPMWRSYNNKPSEKTRRMRPGEFLHFYYADVFATIAW